jgi:hypothetical protein
MFVGALILVPLAIVRLPADYFAPPKRDKRRARWRRPVLRAFWLAGKNFLGGVLVLAGLAMLFLPGQGILTLLLGVSLMDFPGKYRLERWIATRRPVIAAINGLRRRSGAAPLEFGEGLPEERE